MPDRKSFLFGGAVAVALGARADAQTSAPSPAVPAPSPSASAGSKPPSAAALAAATAMRRFDPGLSDAEVTTIARGIDDNARAASRINPKKSTYLKNGDEPVTRFAAAPPEAP